MSDQPPSQKPKPGSLRDRIAAFESSATPPTSAGQRPPPAPRPKPSGFASWKPKVPSPPSSPSSKTTDHASSPPLKATGAMSASDAKESITKGGGSLKDRMAALQGKGAFGAPSPPLAPKPAVEKPRWIPPPAVTPPIDKDANDDEPPTTATLDRTKSPPISVQSRESPDLSKPIAEGEGTSTADSEPTTSTGGDVEGTTDPEEEERQRRAAIAARMARIGGARLGMAPSGLAKKPPMPIRKPTREDVPRQENREERQTTTSEGNIPLPQNTDQGATVTSTTSLTDSPQVQPQSDVELFPVRKSSENVSVDSTDSVTRSPQSMPVPTVPRRAGPPRKKSMKPPPEVPQAQVEEAVTVPSAISTADDQKALETLEEAILAPEHKEPEPKIIDDHRAEIHDEPRSIDSDVQPVEELVVESKPSSSGESKEQGPAHDIQSPPPVEPKQEHKHEHEQPEHSDQPDDVDTIREDQADDDEIMDTDEHSDYDEKPSVEHHEDQHPQRDVGHHVGSEPQSKTASGATGTDEDAEEEEARRKRVAERLAKMGGINPFALPPSRLLSSEDTGHADSSHTSPESVALPVAPDNLTRKASLSSHEVAEPHPLAVEPKVEEKQGEKEFSDDGLSDDARIHKVPMEESACELSSPPPPPPRYEQAEAAPVRQLPGPRPPVPGSIRPHVQVQQYGRHDAQEEHNTHHATRYLPPLSRLPDPPINLEEFPLPPDRPAQPPRRIVPQAPEEQEQEEEEEEAGSDDEVVPSHLFVRPPRDQHPVKAGQHYEVDDGDSSENDTPALPVLQRRSVDPTPPPAALHHLPTPPSDIYEHDSDHDGQELPVRPRHTAVPPTPPSPVLLRPTPRRSVPSAPENEESFSSPYEMPFVAVSEPEPGEILDDEEGDPIDPAFHSPSRRASEANIRASAQDDKLGHAPSPPLPVLPGNVEKREEAQQQQDQDKTKRQTLAERMAKLGGIKFGAAPLPVAVSRPPAPRVSQGDLNEEDGHPRENAEDTEQPVELTEVEEERARKERISAKLAGMGGMRIGMMPMGMGPQRVYSSKDENVPPLSPTRAVPSAPPTLPQTSNTDSKRTSDDGVKVEDDTEEVGYAEETTPPPVPSRGSTLYRRESTGTATSPSSPPIPGSRPPLPAALPNRRDSTGTVSSLSSPIPGSRPPVPAALPNRRASVQTPKSTGSVEVGFSPLRSTFSHVLPQSEYVIVDEPHSVEEGTPPSRRTSRRIAPVRSPPIPTGIPHNSDPNSISSQWELPSIPTADLDLGSGADLSMSSWTDIGEPTSPTPQLSPPPTKQPSLLSHKPKPSELQLSADDLMTIWGRVGVQVCEVATSLFENSKKTIVGDGTYAGFITAVLAGVPNAASISVSSGEYGYLVYAQNGSSVQKRASEIMPGDIVEIHEGKLKGHKGIQAYHQNVGGSGESLLGIVGEFEAKKSKIRVFHANQHVGQQQFVESVSYRLEDLKSGTVKVYRVLEE